jgi:hypothetical protein
MKCDFCKKEKNQMFFTDNHDVCYECAVQAFDYWEKHLERLEKRSKK